MNIYHIPENEQEMNEIYAAISKDEKGEGIVSMQVGAQHMPLIFGHKRLLEAGIIQSALKRMAEDTKKTIQICKYKKTEVIEEFK